MEFNQEGYRVIDTLTYKGEPVVNLCYPLKWDSQQQRLIPNPTIFWLISPKYKRLISHLEEVGKIPEFEQILKDRPDMLESIQQQHKSYRDFRWSLLSEEHQDMIKRKGWTSKFETGIGGIRNFEAVKCLHTHFAHYCHKKDNAIGEIVAKKIEDF